MGWHHWLDLSFREALEAVSPHAALQPCVCIPLPPGRGLWGALLHCALSFPSKGKEAGKAASAVLWAAPGCAVGRVRAGGSQLCSWAPSGCVSRSQECPAQRGASAPGRISACPELQAHATGTPPSPPSVPKGSTMNYRNKNKAKNISIWDILRISENTFNAFWCDHISQLMCVISLFFSLSANPSRNSFCSCALLINPVAFALFYCQVSLHQPQSFYHSCCYQALRMFLTCFFLTEETLCKIHFLCSFTIN